MKFRYTPPVDHGFIVSAISRVYAMFFSVSAGSSHCERKWMLNGGVALTERGLVLADT